MGEIKHHLPYALGGLAYGLLLETLGLTSSGGGHANVIAMLALSPLGVGIFFWPMFGLLASDFESRRSRTLFVFLAATHYASVALYLLTNWQDELRSHRVAFAYSKFVIAFFVGCILYLVGQWFSLV